MDFLNRLDTFLIGGNRSVKPDSDITDRLFDFATNLDPDQLTEEQADILYNIIDDIEFDDEDQDSYYGESIDEAPVKKRINKQDRRKRSMNYRRNKAKIKMKAAKYRKTAKYKQLQKKAKARAKSGRTATGRRKTTYV